MPKRWPVPARPPPPPIPTRASARPGAMPSPARSDGRDVPTTLLTGLPRSGTTLVCALLNRLPDTVALSEPRILALHGDRERALWEIDAFLAMTREAALITGRVPS